MEYLNTHFGELIERIVRKNSPDIESEAKRWGYTANGLYKVFKKKDVGTDILRKVSNLYNVSFPSLLGSSDKYSIQVGQHLAANDSTQVYQTGNGNRIKELEAKVLSLEAQNALLLKMVSILEGRDK